MVHMSKQASVSPHYNNFLEESKTLFVPEDYEPKETEEFMNPVMKEYFRQKLLKWREELLQHSNETLMHLQEDSHDETDLTDRAMTETNRTIELRKRDRERKLITKITHALERIALGTYGYCEMTGEPIGLGRLQARLIATLSLEAQEYHERQEKIQREE